MRKMRLQDPTCRLVRQLGRRELKVRAVLIIRRLRERDLAPQIRSEECIRLRDLKKKRECEKKAYSERHTAAKVAFKKLPIVAVLPLDCVYTSSTPAS